MDTAINTRVATLLRQVAAVELLPRLGRTTAKQKHPGEIVTEADLAAEQALTRGLQQILPGSVVIGEEAASRNPSLLLGLEKHETAWLVDPLDGTRHFAAGAGPFGIMVALVSEGQIQASWIHLPLSKTMAWARRGEGAWLDGERVWVPAASGALTGGLLTRFFPPQLRARADALPMHRTDGIHHCAAKRYLDLLYGVEHVAVYWRTLPWDHAPGVLLIEEAGGAVCRLDGAPYQLVPVEATGLIVAPDATTAAWLCQVLSGQITTAG